MGDLAAELITPILVAIIGGAFMFIVARQNRRATAEHQMIDQLQEQIEKLTASVDASRIRERIRDDYIHQLRDHISAGRKPPPPPWPEGLTR